MYVYGMYSEHALKTFKMLILLCKKNREQARSTQTYNLIL